MTLPRDAIGISDLLNSAKIKDRVDALLALSYFYENPARIENTDADDLNQLFRSLLENVRKERELLRAKASKGKGTGEAATAKRLENAADAVRQFVENTSRRWRRTEVESACKLLNRELGFGRRLCPHLSLHYINALQAIASYRPHLEHIPKDPWIRCVEICFNAILGDSMLVKFSDPSFDDNQSIDASDEDRDIELPTSPNTKKRAATTSIQGGASKRQRQAATASQTASHEQNQFAVLLSTLLTSPNSPITSPDCDYLPSAILRRLRRSLAMYTDSTINSDLLTSVSLTLDHVAYNAIQEVRIFAQETWSDLVSFWPTKGKERQKKETLVIIFRRLLPFIMPKEPGTFATSRTFGAATAVDLLCKVLAAETGCVFELETLRLELLDRENPGSSDVGDNPFVASTFRAGWSFGSSQAFTWALLELQADCWRALFELSEMGATTPSSGAKSLQNPIIFLKDKDKDGGIDKQSPLARKIFDLQILLFFVDRHWPVLHEGAQDKILRKLLKMLPTDHVDTQIWIFMNLAAIAFSERHNTPALKPSEDLKARDSIWDTIWSNTIQRTNVPGPCRAACHAAHSLLVGLFRHTPPSGHIRLTPKEVLPTIENFGKNIDVQGPTHPYDSVCMFLRKCLQIAAQDERLHRLHLEDKFCAWFTSTWTAAEAAKGGPLLYTVSDTLTLLEAITGLGKQSDLGCRIALPVSPIVESMKEERKLLAIRDYSIFASLPAFVQSRAAELQDAYRLSDVGLYPFTSSPNDEPVKPSRCGTTILAFFSKTLKAIDTEWTEKTSNGAHPSVEFTRRALDFAITAMAFEGAFAVNSTVSEIKVSPDAGKLMRTVVTFVKTARWNAEEQFSLLIGLECLVSTSSPLEDAHWDGVAQPDYANDGMARVYYPKAQEDPMETTRRKRSALLRAIWQSHNLQSYLKDLTKVIREITEASARPAQSGGLVDMDVDDDFGELKTATSNTANYEAVSRDTVLRQRIHEVNISILTRGPLLQTFPEQPTRDRALLELVAYSSPKRMKPPNKPDKSSDANEPWFLMVAPLLFREIRAGALECNDTQLVLLLEAASGVLSPYQYDRNPESYCLVIRILHSTLPIWTRPAASEKLKELLGKILEHLCNNCNKDLMYSWKIRDTFSQFLEEYVSFDPQEATWKCPGSPPLELLKKLAKDEDIRVRYRTVVSLPRLIVLSYPNPTELVGCFLTIRDSLPSSLQNYESTITRILTFANMMVVSSAIRRGAYWNLLEIFLKGPAYRKHIEASLKSAVERLGMPSVASLFECYAPQLSYTMVQTGIELSKLPWTLMGYDTKAKFYQAAFRRFIPTYTVLGALPQLQTHCENLAKDPLEGQRECIGDIVGLFSPWWFQNSDGGDDEMLERELEAQLLEPGTLGVDIDRNVDKIVAAILRTLGDQDYAKYGPIYEAIQSAEFSDQGATKVFSELTKYWNRSSFQMHAPSLPTFTPKNVVQALGWLARKTRRTLSKDSVYHVLHDLLADVQETPLVNEKYRLLNSLCMWISLNHEQVQDPAILLVILNGAAALLGQHHLCRPAQSILEWAFATSRSVISILETDSESEKANKPPYLSRGAIVISRVLARASAICHEYSQATDEATANLGFELSLWIDKEALALCRKGDFQLVVKRALLAWPREPSPELAGVCGDSLPEDVAKVLADDPASSNKFRLVRKLKESLRGNGHFERQAFWRLKESIPPNQKLREEDALAFTDLLVNRHGRVHGLTAEPTNSLSIRGKHRTLINQKGYTKNIIRIGKEAIVYGLLMLLDDESPVVVHTAHETLRLLNPTLVERPAQYDNELKFINSLPLPPLKQSPQNLYDALSHKEWLEYSTNFPEWVMKLTGLIADTLIPAEEGFGQLHPIISTNAPTAEQVLPVLVLCLLDFERKATPPRSTFKERISSYFTTVLKFPNASLSTIRCIIEVVLHLRYFQTSHTNHLSSNSWLQLDFMLLAESAVQCGAYTTAVLFLELATDLPSGLASMARTELVEKIQYRIYEHIDEPDGFYGIQTENLDEFLIRRLHHEKQWDRAFRLHGATLEANASSPSTSDSSGVVNAFYAFGFNQLALSTLERFDAQGASRDGDDASMSYKVGWRSGTWDLPDRDTYCPGASLYSALSAVSSIKDTKTVDSLVRASLYKEIQQLHSLGIESIAEIREVLQSLMCLNQIVCWRTTLMQPSKVAEASVWDDFATIPSGFEFSDLENIMSTRITLVKAFIPRNPTDPDPYMDGLLELERRCLLFLSRSAREANQTQIALNSILRAQKLGKDGSTEISQEHANVLWSIEEPKLAVIALQNMVDSWKPGDGPDYLQATLLAQLGTWMSEACLGKPTEIWETYFNRAISMLGDTEEMVSASKVFHQCADFADKQYHTLRKSPDMIRTKVYMERKRQEVAERAIVLQTLRGSDRYAYEKQIKEAEQIFKTDEQLHERLKAAQTEFLKQALNLYSRSLRLSDSFDHEAPIKFTSLWFANFDDESVQESVIQAAVRQIPSRKFIFLAHQLTARMTSTPIPSQSKHQQCLRNLVMRLCREHPFHSLYQVYCLQADVSDDLSQGRRSEAQRVLSELKADSDELLKERATQVVNACQAYVQWAKHSYLPQKDKLKNGTAYKIHTEAWKLRTYLVRGNLRIPVLTADTQIDPSMRYEACEWISHYGDTFKTAGGVNLPKIVSCYSVSGREYKQLFKGNDDMRQDAVMEQVFELVNRVLSADRETTRRSLQVRGYKVVPLGTQAGVLEFVPNTTPLRDWLMKGHTDYRPGDWKPNVCYTKLRGEGDRMKQGKATRKDMVRIYTQVCNNFKPVFRHFFTEKHKNPMAWFATRLGYTRSVATTSIVGHILGLGDRHTSNILMDNITGEVIHIDLGIAFGQGKLLPVPELVPFRLTRDMVDGMGSSGTQGVFQRCAEETLRVLRDGSDVIMTVLEVFKYDPLHSWIASEFRVQKAQLDDTDKDQKVIIEVVNKASRDNAGITLSMDSGVAEEAADRALTSVSRKLDKSLSVESTVNELIAEATDVQNLAVIFAGWGPHL
ncbi:hypothetical protein D9611_014266 [Ephemerocybe angulata]|uniref:Serine/threonine-protein kinase Tel1 n=1 Tax=Ephemerocybe angulata TaxID=980116 RepID=A0A8H5F9N9_9AGAR|nr:hypothetical protein D9611_014266 [Tulosesus angulatus]